MGSVSDSNLLFYIDGRLSEGCTALTGTPYGAGACTATQSPLALAPCTNVLQRRLISAAMFAIVSCWACAEDAQEYDALTSSPPCFRTPFALRGRASFASFSESAASGVPHYGPSTLALGSEGGGRECEGHALDLERQLHSLKEARRAERAARRVQNGVEKRKRNTPAAFTP